MTTITTEATPVTPDDFWGPPISIYTRAQAIEDGVLVDVSDWAGAGPNGMMGGFRVPTVLTRALWDVVDLDADDQVRWRQQARQRGESTRGRAHDVLFMTRLAAGQHPHADRVHVAVLMTGEGKQGRLVRRTMRLLAVIDGDGITIGFPEDF
jgi:hypothetical protein